MKKQSLEFITKIPKSDLHVHLDGSVRVETLIELSKQEKNPLPSYTVDGLNKLVFKDQYKNLVEYLQGFGLIVPIMQTQENLERISYEFAKDCIKDGVLYVEVRFAPQLHINNKQNIDQVLLGVNRGLYRAKLEHNNKSTVKNKKQPPFDYGIIVCAMRYFTRGFSKFLDLFFDAHQHTSFSMISAMTSYELAKAAVRIRDQYAIPIVALDLAGAEDGNPPILHKDAYHFAHKNFMHLTVHAGEASGPESIFQAVTELYPERIGHGFHLFDKKAIIDKSISKKQKYIDNLVQYLAKQRTTIEVCLTSNWQTISELKKIKDHSLSSMLKNNISVAICTDNKTISKTNMSKELHVASQAFELGGKKLKDLVINGFKKSFYFGPYNQKVAYIKQISDYYDIVSNSE